MDPRKNPYAPGAGTKPPALVGRDSEIESFDILLERLENGYSEQSMIITGLRGVGKTVLLDVFREKAEDRNWATVEWEVEKNTPLGQKMSNQIRRALLQIAPKARWTERARKTAAILKSFSITFNPDGAVTAGLDVDPMPGIGDSGMLANDLTDLFVALGDAAGEQNIGVIFLLDEIQYLAAPELEALITALHKCARRALPVTMVGAGLPQIPRLAGEAKSYSERLFQFPKIGKLDLNTFARDALVLPAKTLNVQISSQAVDYIIEYTEGYPYFLQEYGKFLWDEASDSPISEAIAKEVQPLVEAKLDNSFFRVRVDRTTELELKYLFAMAQLGSHPQKASDVAKELGRSTEQVGPIRSRLINKGLLYTPGHGFAAFTVPQFDRYLLRRHSDLGE